MFSWSGLKILLTRSWKGGNCPGKLLVAANTKFYLT